MKDHYIAILLIASTGAAPAVASKRAERKLASATAGFDAILKDDILSANVRAIESKYEGSKCILPSGPKIEFEDGSGWGTYSFSVQCAARIGGTALSVTGVLGADGSNTIWEIKFRGIR